VQWVNRPNSPTDKALHDFRGLSGMIASGIVRKGQQVVVLPIGIKTTVKDIWTFDGSLAEAFCPQSVTICIEHDIDVSRGDMLVGLENLPGRDTDLYARVCWMHQRPLQAGKKYLLKHTTQTVQVAVMQIENKINFDTLEPEPAPVTLAMNDIGGVKFRTAKPLVFDGYSTNRLTGSFILIEPGTNATVGAGMLSTPKEAVKPEYTDFAI
jgi:bifunctional enzyme CysN/CysC/sulfate adenylyltransferase subunit 1